MKLLSTVIILFTFFLNSAWAESITVHKSPTCGCCVEWIKIMEAAGHEVEVEHPSSLQRTKDKLGVPEQLGSCHTAVINDYIFEGHIPEADIIAFLANPPAGARGLAVPGMPAHSPGMAAPGVSYSGFNVIQFDDENKLSLFRAYP